MSVNTSQLVCACSEDAARDAVWAGSLARVNTLTFFTHTEEESPQSLVTGRVGGTVLSSKGAKNVFSLSGSKTLVSATWLVFLL